MKNRSQTRDIEKLFHYSYWNFFSFLCKIVMNAFGLNVLALKTAIHLHDFSSMSFLHSLNLLLLFRLKITGCKLLNKNTDIDTNIIRLLVVLIYGVYISLHSIDYNAALFKNKRNTLNN